MCRFMGNSLLMCVACSSPPKLIPLNAHMVCSFMGILVIEIIICSELKILKHHSDSGSYFWNSRSNKYEYAEYSECMWVRVCVCCGRMHFMSPSHIENAIHLTARQFHIPLYVKWHKNKSQNRIVHEASIYMMSVNVNVCAAAKHVNVRMLMPHSATDG